MKRTRQIARGDYAALQAKHTFRYNTIGEYADDVARYCRDNIRHTGSHKASEETRNNRFYGYMSLSRAVKLGVKGGYWEEGTHDIQPIELTADQLIEGSEFDVPKMQNDIQGFMPLVPNYLVGTPDSMLAFQDEPQPNKLLKIGVAVVHLCDVTKEQIFNRGNAILSVVDQLELLGYSSEIWALYRSKNTWGRGTSLSLEVCVKPADRKWDAASVAFALCHAAFARRLGFRFLEAQMEDDLSEITQCSYGIGLPINPTDYDLAYSYLSSGTGYETRQQGLDTILATSVEQIKQRNAKDFTTAF